MQVYTIGFTKKSAAQFFELLRTARIELLVDVRLNNVSQLAGFSKKEDLAYFLQTICGAEYRHETLLAPTQSLLDEYKKTLSGWDRYAEKFMHLLEERQVERKLSPSLFAKRTVLLCSEPTAECCHRRLVIEYLNSKWSGIEAVHL